MNIRTMIIEDEINPRKALRRKVNAIFTNDQKEYPVLELVAECASSMEAHDKIIELQPDLIFLDIAMPVESGFDLLIKIPNRNFEVIFVTGYDEYAIQAINFCALGYLLKPVDDKELISAVINAKKRIETQKQNENLIQLVSNFNNPEDSKIAIPITDGLEFILVKDIVHLEGDQRYTHIHMKDQKTILSSYNIGKFARLLEGFSFFLTHRSHLINLKHIDKFNNVGEVTMCNQNKIPVSRRKKNEFIELISKMI